MNFVTAMSACFVFDRCPLQHPRHRAGFTLVELIATVAIIAALASLAYTAYAGIQKQTNEQLAEVRLAQLAQAMKRFRADMGYYPNDEIMTGTIVCPHDSDSAAGLAVDPTRWSQSPANLWLLYEAPKFCPAHRPELSHLSDWDRITHRGWRGPYLAEANLAWLDLGDGAMPALAAGNPQPKQDDFSWYRSKSDTTDSTKRIGGFGRPITLHKEETVDGKFRRRYLAYWGNDGKCSSDPANLDDSCDPQIACDSATSPACDNIVIYLEN